MKEYKKIMRNPLLPVQADQAIGIIKQLAGLNKGSPFWHSHNSYLAVKLPDTGSYIKDPT